MFLYIGILLLLWLVNFAPPFSALLLHERYSTPVDGGRIFRDGRRVFGPNKTVRGIVSGCLAGMVLAPLIPGLSAWTGLAIGALSMSGDLLSSFIKRRLAKSSGAAIPVLDQFFEGIFPLLLLVSALSLSPSEFSWLLLVFVAGAFSGSVFYTTVLRSVPFKGYPRPVSTRVRLRELRACQLTARPYHHFINLEDSVYYNLFLRTFFKLTGLYEKGTINALTVGLKEETIQFPELPQVFDGYRILFLSDLHIDGLDGLEEVIARIIEPIEADLCVFGGDYRMETHGPFDLALERMWRVAGAVHARDGMVGILGNHDCLEAVSALEDAGIDMLINESVKIERSGERIWFAGVDDPHYFECHDPDRALSGVPPEGFKVLLAHSNEIYREAADLGVHLYLCGHSHAGQIRLPGLGAVFTHSSAPRRFHYGKWLYRGMQGYTSGGAGVSGVPVRFGCKGEVSLLTLRKSGP